MPQANRTGKKPGSQGARSPAGRSRGKPASKGKEPGEEGFVEVASIGRAQATVDTSSLNEERRTVDIVWSVGADVIRYDWWTGERYIESLSMDPAHIRMRRFEAGMSLLDSHMSYSMDERLGYVLPESVRVENGVGYATVQLSRKDRAEDLLQDLRDGIPFPVSVGYATFSYEKTEATEGSLARLHATDWEPMELSAVPVPADPDASSRSEDTEAAKHQRVVVTQSRNGVGTTRTKETDMPQANRTGRRPLTENNPGTRADGGEGGDDEEDDVEDQGQGGQDQGGAEDEGEEEGDEGERASGRRQTRRAAPGRSDQHRSAAISEETRLEIRNEARAAANQIRTDEATRISAIRSLGTRSAIPVETIAEHIEKGTKVEDFRQVVLDALIERSSVAEGTGLSPSGISLGEDGRGARREAMVNAIMHRSNPGVHALSDHGREYRGMTLMDMARAEQEDRGERTRGMTKNEIATRAFHTTSDFPIILQNVVRASLRDAYDLYPQTFQALGRRATAPDFKEMTLLALSDGPKLLKINEHGEYKRGTLRESSQSYKIATYGRMISVTRQLLINDSLGAFTRIPALYGNSIASLESDIVWDNLIANQVMADGLPLFHASHGNLLPTPAPFSADALGAMRTLMGKQRGEHGQLNLRPAFLVVAPELEYTAEKLLGTAYTPTTAADATPDSLKRLQLVVEPRMSALNDGYAFMLVANPAQIDTFEYTYLEGEEGAYMETKEGWDVDGMEVKCRLDFGSSVIDEKAFVLNMGVRPQ